MCACVCVCVCVCVLGQHFFIQTSLVKQYGHVFSTYLYFDLFKPPYECYNIRTKLADKFAVASCFRSTFGPFADHHRGMCVLSNRLP